MSIVISKEHLDKIELVIFDFDGVFTDNSVYVSQEGIEQVSCWRSDGLGISRLQSAGFKMYIISTESNPVVSVRAKKLNIPCVQNVKDKSKAVLSLTKKTGIPLENTLYLGNDINDIGAFKIVGFPIAVADSYPEVHQFVRFLTEKPGGRGAVREVCDLIYHSKLEKREIGHE